MHSFCSAKQLEWIQLKLQLPWTQSIFPRAVRGWNVQPWYIHEMLSILPSLHSYVVQSWAELEWERAETWTPQLMQCFSSHTILHLLLLMQELPFHWGLYGQSGEVNVKNVQQWKGSNLKCGQNFVTGWGKNGENSTPYLSCLKLVGEGIWESVMMNVSDDRCCCSSNLLYELTRTACPRRY